MIRRILCTLTLSILSLSAFAADLSVEISASDTTFVNGQSGSFTTTVRNLGPEAHDANVQVQFTSQSGVIDETNIQLVSKPANFTCGAQFETAQGHTFSCTASAIPAGYEGQIVYSTVITGTTGTGYVRSSVFAPANDPEGANNLAQVSISVAPPPPAVADLTATLVPSSTSFLPGSTGTFSTTIRNLGPDAVPAAAIVRFTAYSGTIDATSIQVVSKPAEFTCGAQYDTPQGHHQPCNAPSIPAGYEGTIVLSAVITGTSGNMDVEGSVAVLPGDASVNNNFSNATITVAQPVADLAVDLTSSTPAAVTTGAVSSYLASFENDGPDASPNATLSFRFTALSGSIGVTNIQVTSKPAAFTCAAPVATPQGPLVTCTTPSFASGATGAIAFSAEVTGTSGTMEVCAFFLSSSSMDPDTNGQLNGDCIQNTVSADPSPATLSMSCPGAFLSGGTGGGSVTLSAARGTDTIVALSSSNSAVATVPASVVILAGLTSANFTVTGIGPGTATITATPPVGVGVAQNCNVTVNPTVVAATIGLGEGNCQAAPIPPGTNGTGTVTMSPVAATDTVIALQSSDPTVATVPGTVTILAGQTSATFTITGVSGGTATITASAPDAVGGDSASCLTIVSSAAEVSNVPSLSPEALVLLAALLGGLALFVMRR
jgi:hypothetical protein